MMMTMTTTTTTTRTTTVTNNIGNDTKNNNNNSTLFYYCVESTARWPITDTAEHKNMNNKGKWIGHYETNTDKTNKQKNASVVNQGIL